MTGLPDAGLRAAPPRVWMLADIEFEVSKLALGPNDIVVFRTHLPLGTEAAAEVRSLLKSIFGADRLGIVLCSGAELSSLTRSDIEAMAK